ncbi:piggyBac transposable element-derived protein 4-like [Halyomorpha halys]|uniref:piggyBac transposable element-derived protein 4-like n=1 Tax=Halyomorpha halys TaxID=286706 RepID=UPI0006D4FEB8
MLELIHKFTNQEIGVIKKGGSEQKEIDDVDEIKAFIGLLIYGGAKQDNHLTTTILFNVSQCGYWYRTAMALKRFEYLLRALRFDDKTCRPDEKFAPISELWGMFIEECKRWYKPGSYVTIDEQLVGFRGNCPFRMYLPNKPAKYGLKIIAMVDSSTKYLLNAIPYTGKGSTPANQPAAAYFVKKLVEPIENSNRNITIDNWFTSIKLVSDMVEKGLTVVGTIRKDKIELPPSFVDVKFKNRKVGSSLFLYHSDMTAVSYKVKVNKLVTLVSSMHDTPELHPFSKKPFIIHSYNATKGGVDTLDQLCAHSSCNRKTKRWPVCFFYNMINIACVNSFVIYQHNFQRLNHKKENAGKPLTRLQFMIKLHEQLTYNWKQKRLANTVRMNSNLKHNISQSLVESLPAVDEPSTSHSIRIPKCSPDQTEVMHITVDEPSPGLKGETMERKKKIYYKLGNCAFCPSRLRKKAIASCSQCQRRICGGHIKKKENFCVDCSLE